MASPPLKALPDPHLSQKGKINREPEAFARRTGPAPLTGVDRCEERSRRLCWCRLPRLLPAPGASWGGLEPRQCLTGLGGRGRAGKDAAERWQRAAAGLVPTLLGRCRRAAAEPKEGLFLFHRRPQLWKMGLSSSRTRHRVTKVAPARAGGDLPLSPYASAPHWFSHMPQEASEQEKATFPRQLPPLRETGYGRATAGPRPLSFNTMLEKGDTSIIKQHPPRRPQVR
nr:PREDICTED: uncharacterized protein C14orf105 homolog [Apteryx mantelli mantelli]